MPFKDLHYLPLVQLGNIALLDDDEEKAEKYYEQIKCRHININSKKFFKLQLKSVHSAYENEILPVAINCQKILIKFDPKFKHANHYHNLACFYVCAGNVKEANETFKKGLMYPPDKVTDSLQLEYAQFLIQNKENPELDVNFQDILHYLHLNINNDNNEEMQYGKIEKNTVCPFLQNLIIQKNGTIDLNAKALAFYLMIDQTKHLGENNNIINLLESFRNYCDSLQDEVSFRLLSDAFKLVGNEQCALEYSKYANFIGEIDNKINGKAELNLNKNKLNFKDIYEFTIKLDKLALKALAEENLYTALNFYSKVFQIYTLILNDQTTEHFQYAVNNLATFYLIIQDFKNYLKLKALYKLKLNHDLIKMAKVDLDEIIQEEEYDNNLYQESQQEFLNIGFISESSNEDMQSEVFLIGEM